MMRSAAQDKYKALHEERPYHDGSFTDWAKDRSAQYPFHFEAGVTVDVAEDDLHPWDEFTKKVDASPVPHEAPTGEDEIHDGQ